MNKWLENRFSPAPTGALRVVLAVLPLLVITTLVIAFRPDLSHLASYGYLGVFALMFLSSATVLLPMPGLAAVAAAGILWNPLLVGLAGGLGGATGELIGYTAGSGARELVNAQQGRWADWVRRFVTKYGFFAMLALAAIPNPLFDVVGIAAGSLSYPAWRFYIAVAIGNTIKCCVIATVGDVVSLQFWPH